MFTLRGVLMALHFILCTAIIAASLIAVLTARHAQSPKHSEAASQPTGHGAVLVELLVPEACLSRPPADALLREIDDKYYGVHQLVAGVSEHFTYWNQFGWSDPFPASASTERQDAYRERSRLDSVCTPPMVIHGEEQILGRDSTGLPHATRKDEQHPQLVIHIASASMSGNMLDVEFSVSGSLAGGADVFAILAGDMASSIVFHGEDSGSTLSHVSAARTITRLGTLQAETERPFLIPLSTAVQLPPSRGRHLIIFAQVPGFGRVLGVDTRPL
jgi:hypothetical protein